MPFFPFLLWSHFKLHSSYNGFSNGIRFSVTSLAQPNARLLTPVYAKRAPISLFDALTPSSSGLIFPDETIEEVATALTGFHHLAIAHGVKRENELIFATEAMRRADNAGDMLAAISKATGGLSVQILEPHVEALFGAVMGSRSGISSVPKGALFLDLGGGSVQMTWVDTSVEGYEIQAATAGSSMPYGAARTMRIFNELDHKQQQAEIQNLRSGMQTVYAVLCSQFPALGAIKAAHERGDKASVDVYMCGGGFRGYGSMLMHKDPIKDYPMATTHLYTVTGDEFKKTHEMMNTNQLFGGNIYGLSKRRREQFPAIVTVLDAFINAVPNIGNVTFCGGSNREGALLMMMSPSERERNPVEVLASVSDAERPVLDAVLDTLTASLPLGVDVATMPTVLLTPGLGYLFVQKLWQRRGFRAEVNSAWALHDAIHRDSNCPGLTHLDRALLGLTLCSFWGGKLTDADQKLYESFETIVQRHNVYGVYWAKYLGAMAAALLEVVPAMPSSPEQVSEAIE